MPDSASLHPAAAFEVERLGDHADSQNAHLAGRPGDDRSRACAGAAAHSSGDKDHMRAGEVIANLLQGFFRRGFANLWLGARAEALGHLKTHLDDALGAGRRQRLSVRVGHNEIDPGEARDDHVVDRVSACAAHAAYDDARLQFPQFRGLQIDRHVCLIPLSVRRRRFDLRDRLFPDLFDDDEP